MSQQADAQRLPQDNVSGAFDLPEMETAPQPPPAFVEEPPVDAAAARAKKRRGWLIVAAAILIPAGLAAAVVAIVAMGTTEVPAPAPVVPAAATQPATAPAATGTETRPTAVRGSAATDAAGSSGSAASTAAATGASAADAAGQSSTAAAAQPAAAPQVNAAAEPEAAAPAPLTPAEQLAAWSNTTIVEVAEGDTLWGFALQYGTTVEAIEMLNAVTADSLELGARITIPVGFAADLSTAPAPAVAEQNAGQVTWRPVETTESGNAFASDPAPDTPLSAWPNISQVTVAYGDTLDAIAYEYGTSTEAIMVLSGITNPHELYPGDLLSVPVGYTAEVASVAVPEWVPPAVGEEAAAGAAAPATGAAPADGAAGAADGAAETENIVLLPVSSAGDAAAPAETPATETPAVPAAPVPASDELVLEDAAADELLLAGDDGAAAEEELLLEE